MADQNIKPLNPVAPPVDTLKKKKSPARKKPAPESGKDKKNIQPKKGLIDTYV